MKREGGSVAERSSARGKPWVASKNAVGVFTEPPNCLLAEIFLKKHSLSADFSPKFHNSII
jgi:hypothetical protein